MGSPAAMPGLALSPPGDPLQGPDAATLLSLAFSPVAMQSVIFPLINYTIGIGVLLYDVITFFIAMSNGQGDQYRPLGNEVAMSFLGGNSVAAPDPPSLLQRASPLSRPNTGFLGLGALGQPTQGRSQDPLGSILRAISSGAARYGGPAEGAALPAPLAPPGNGGGAL